MSPFGVAEAWSGERDIDALLADANEWSDNPISAFDFPLRYRLKDLCDGVGVSLRRLAEPGTRVGSMRAKTNWLPSGE